MLGGKPDRWRRGLVDALLSKRGMILALAVLSARRVLLMICMGTRIELHRREQVRCTWVCCEQSLCPLCVIISWIKDQMDSSGCFPVGLLALRKLWHISAYSWIHGCRVVLSAYLQSSCFCLVWLWPLRGWKHGCCCSACPWLVTETTLATFKLSSCPGPLAVIASGSCLVCVGRAVQLLCCAPQLAGWEVCVSLPWRHHCMLQHVACDCPQSVTCHCGERVVCVCVCALRH